MSPDLQNKVFAWIEQTASKISDWTVDNVPPFINEFLTWRFYENVIGMCQYVGGLIFFIAVVSYIWKWYNKEALKDPPTGESAFWCPVFFKFLPAFILVVGGCHKFPTENIKTCVQIKVAPKVYLVDQAAQFFKSQSK